ncbi:LPD7 domain-containing protein [Azospirillum endophyticum]
MADTLPPSVSPGDGAARRRRRERHLAGLLREHYGTGWLPESVAANLARIELDRAAGTATLHLRGGGRLIDCGDRLVLHGRPREAAVAELVAAVDRHGWTSVTLTGDPAFRVAVAAALADRRPSVAVVGLDEADRQAVGAELARRAEERRRVALDALRAAERDHLARLAGRQPTARDAAMLEAVRDAQAAASWGDAAAVRAAAEGDIEGAVRAGAALRRREEAPAATSEPATDGPQAPAPAYRPPWTQGPPPSQRF